MGVLGERRDGRELVSEPVVLKPKRSKQHDVGRTGVESNVVVKLKFTKGDVIPHPPFSFET